MVNIRGVYQQIHPREVQVFPEEYFSGADISIYFNDVWIDDITGLSFNVTENCRPQYGYADYTLRRVIRGQRIVNGHFRIAFKGNNYLYKVVRHMQIPRAASTVESVLTGSQKQYDWRTVADEIANNVITQMVVGVQSASVDFRWSIMGKGLNNNPNDVIELQRILYDLGYLKDQTSITGFFNDNTEYAVKMFQQDYGLTPTGIVDNDTRRKLADLTQPPSYYATGYYTNVPPGTTTIEQMSENSNTTVVNRTLFDFDSTHLSRYGFDIVIAYGPIPEDYIHGRTKVLNYNTAVIVLKGCYILSVGQSIDNNGQPVEEVYEFIATDIEEK